MIEQIKTFYGPAPGIYPPMLQMNFSKNSSVEVLFRSFKKDETCCDSKTEVGTWKISCSEIIVSFKNIKLAAMKGRVVTGFEKNVLKSIALDFGDDRLTPFYDPCSI